MKRYLYLLLFFLISVPTLIQSQPNRNSNKTLEVLQNPKLKRFPLNQRLFLHINKTVFQGNDTIWLKGYSVQGPLQQASKISQTMTVALLNSKNEVVSSDQFLVLDGTAEGQLIIDKSVGFGMFQLVAYGSNMLNQGAKNIFSTTIEIKPSILPKYNFTYGYNQLFYRNIDTLNMQILVHNKNFEPHPVMSIPYRVWHGKQRLLKGKVKTNTKGVANLSIPLQQLDSIPEAIQLSFEAGNVQAPFISNTYALTLKKAIDVQVLPEGGDLVADLVQFVAFRSVDHKGKPIDISGNVVDEKGETITPFSSAHNGMGKFMMVPKFGKNYQLQITSPKEYVTNIPFPKVLKQGYTLSFLGEKNQSAIFKVSKNFEGVENITAVWQVDGVLLSAQTIALDKTETVAFSTKLGLPASIAKLTLFNSDAQPLAERLVFVPDQKNTNVEFHASQRSYGRRIKGEIDLKLTSEKKEPIQANLSVLITHINDGLSTDLPIPDIRDYTVFKNELSGTVYQPEQYFGKGIKDKVAMYRADLLMLTHGWRKFSWFKDLEKKVDPNYEYFNYDLYRGVVTKGKKPVAKAKVAVHSWGVGIDSEEITADEDGRFWVQPVFTDKTSPTIIISTDRKNIFSRARLRMNDRELEMRDSFVQLFYPNLMPYVYQYNTNVVKQTVEEESFLKIWETKYLSELTVVGEDLPSEMEDELSRFDIAPNFMLKKEDFNGLMDMEGMIMQLAGGLYINYETDQLVRMYQGAEVNIPFIIDGVQWRDATFSDISIYSSDMIDGIAYVRNNTVQYELQGGGSAGALYIYTSKTKNQAVELKDKTNIYKSYRYSKVKEFYAPKYDVRKLDEILIEDNRTTLLWDNTVKTDSLGNAQIPFFTGDKKGRYLINVQGVTAKNGPVFQETTITVK